MYSNLARCWQHVFLETHAFYPCSTTKKKLAQGHARISFFSCASRHAVGRNRPPQKKNNNAGANDGDGDGDGAGAGDGDGDDDDDDDDDTHIR